MNLTLKLTAGLAACLNSTGKCNLFTPWRSLGVMLLGSSLLTQAAPALDRSVLPPPAPTYTAVQEITGSSEKPVFHRRLQAPENAPNILLVMTDDVGFASASTFGGSVPTPNLDRLAEKGLRYNRFHTTGICSPTRAALLTGRNHHVVGTGTLVDVPTPYPGYTAHIPNSTATIARVLGENGYSTAMFGKDHNIPGNERSPSGPFDQWPTGRGFDYFYGFIAGDTDQWRPALYEGITPVDTSQRPDDYLVDKELADKAINWIHNQKAATPDKPFFIYLAPGSSHAPHQAPKEWIAKFKGQFDHGWDKERELILARQKAQGIVPPSTKLSPRPDIIPAWDSLSDNERKVHARLMEVYAAMLSYQDAQFGRIMDELERMGMAENTLVVFIEGDNGSSGEGGLTGSLNEMGDLSAPGEEHLDMDWVADNLDLLGGPDTYQGYSIGWTFATNTPFPWFKQHASHLGGVRNGMVISWPQRITQTGEVREQYHHVIDVMPTLLEAANLPPPSHVHGVEQRKLDGISMSYSFAEAEAASQRRTQYYEVNGNRGIYHDGWLANTTPRNMPWNFGTGTGSDVTDYPWELYHLDEDFSQSNNLAAAMPEKLAEMQARFDAEARQHMVYPIQDLGGKARGMQSARIAKQPIRTEYEYFGAGIRLQMLVAPPITTLPFTLEADITVPEAGGEGVILAAGSYFGGWSFYLQDGKPVAFASTSPLGSNGQARVAAQQALTPGRHTVRFELQHDGKTAGEMTIFVDDQQVAIGQITQRPYIIAGNGETIDTGRDTNVPVSKDYEDEGVFNGDIHKITINIKLPLVYRAMQAIGL